MSRSLEGKVAWITGGGTGIGRALALEFAKRGAKVAVSGRRRDRLDAVTLEIAALGGEGLSVVCDVVVEDQQRAAVEAILQKFGRLDIAVANAGFGVMGKVEELTFEDWRRQFDTNVISAAITAKVAVPELKKTGGRVALVASVAAYVTTPKGGAYAASKAALRAIGDALWMELRGTGASCTTIHPGFVESEIAQVDNEGVHHPGRPDKRPAKLMWKAEDAARVMADAIQARKREFVFTGHGKLAVLLARLFPGVLASILSKTKHPKE